MSRARQLLIFGLLLPSLTLLFGARALAEPLVLVDVNVIPMDRERVVPAQVVVIEDGKIRIIGPLAETPVPDAGIHVDAAGQYLIPGLAEMHAHLPPRPGRDRDRVMTLFLANGITLVRSMLGAPSHLTLRDEINAGTRLGPRVIASGPSFNGRSVRSPAQARALAREQEAAGYDFFKLHPGLERAEYDALMETAGELGVPVGGHVSLDVGLDRALAARQATIDHLDGYLQALVRDGVDYDAERESFFAFGLASDADRAKLTDVAARTAAAGVWNVPTQTLIENIVSAETPGALRARYEMRYMSRDTVARWTRSKSSTVDADNFDPEVGAAAIAVRRELIKALHDAGAGLLLGSDSPQVFNVPGFATHRELGVLVAAGLTPYEALRTGTANPAVFLGEPESFGTVAVGRSADLILLRANPLENIVHTQNIAGVVRAGQWLPRKKLDQMVAQFAQAQSK